MEFHGDADTQIPYTGGSHNGECLPTIPHWVQQWASRDGYSIQNTSTALGTSGNVKYEFGTPDAAGDYHVTHYMIHGLGHEWATNFNNFSSSPLMIDFFSRWTL